MTMTQVIILGGGGHAKVTLEAMRLAGRCKAFGILDANAQLHGQKICDVPVLGDDSKLPEVLGQGVRHFLVCLGSTGNSDLRRKLYDWAIHLGLMASRIIHPSAVVSSAAELGDGAVVLAGAIINCGARLGANVIVNTGAIVEHDCQIGAHCHIATGACLAGGTHVGSGSHIGIGACVRQNIQIGRDVIVGAGAVVVKDVPDNVVVMGVPARIVRPTHARTSLLGAVEKMG
jgi:sugar O-acyltransferase (sialic acid O-acetyltransferase NeuD family)